MNLPDGSSEADTERDGVLSYAAEWHAFTNGLFKGFVRLSPKPTEPDSLKERHYYRGAYLLGYALKLFGLYQAGGALL